MRRSLPFSLFLLAACTPTVDQFRSDFPGTFCAYAVPCLDELPPEDGDTGEVSTASCEAELVDYIDTLAGDEGCTFDGEAAQACLDSLEAPTCSEAEGVRDACENVFVGDDCDLHLSALL